jgi:hypothetical protein
VTLQETQRPSPWRRWQLWLALAGFLAGLSGTLWLALAGCSLGSLVDYLLPVASGSGLTILGGLILAAQPGNRIGWLCLVSGLSFLLQFLFGQSVECEVEGLLALPGTSILAWLAYVVPYQLVAGVFVLLPFWFPDGRFLSPRWRRLAFFSLGTIGLVAALMAILPGSLQYNGIGNNYPVDNPLGQPFLPVSLGPFVGFAGPLLAIAGAFLAILSFIARWRSARGDTRQQLKWFAYFLATAVATHLIAFEFLGGLFYPAIFDTWLYEGITLITFLGFPLVIGVAVFKYRLYDIDLLIRRTLLYGVLTAILALVYFGAVTLMQSVIVALSDQQSPVIIVVSTLVIAALFNPLRRRLQTFIDRRFFRQKYDAAQTLAAFAQTARDEVDLDDLAAEIIRVVQETMQPAGVSIWLLDEGSDRDQ